MRRFAWDIHWPIDNKKKDKAMIICFILCLDLLSDYLCVDPGQIYDKSDK